MDVCPCVYVCVCVLLCYARCLHGAAQHCGHTHGALSAETASTAPVRRDHNVMPSTTRQLSVAQTDMVSMQRSPCSELPLWQDDPWAGAAGAASTTSWPTAAAVEALCCSLCRRHVRRCGVSCHVKHFTTARDTPAVSTTHGRGRPVLCCITEVQPIQVQGLHRALPVWVQSWRQWRPTHMAKTC